MQSKLFLEDVTTKLGSVLKRTKAVDVFMPYWSLVAQESISMDEKKPLSKYALVR